MPFCDICGGYIYSSREHKCPPVFEVQEIEYHGEDEWEEIRAVDEQDAAEKYAEKSDCDSAEYSIVSGSDAEVWVRKKGDSEVKKFMVSGESVPTYHADEIGG
jgi:hypothetical protein